MLFIGKSISFVSDLGSKAKAKTFKHTTRAEIEIHSMSDSLSA